MWHSIIPFETTTSFTRHIIICNAVTFPNQVVGGRESLLNKGNFFMPWMTLIKKLIRMCLGITDPTTTPLRTSTGQILNFGGHDGSECHRVPLPIRLNRKRFREQIGKCCTAFATTRHSKCDAVISFIWINSSRRSESQAAITQCNQKMKVKAVMMIFGRSLTSGDLFVHFFNIFWNHFHSWNTLSTSLCSSFPFRTYCISQGMVRVCPFAIFLIGPWLEIDPSASEQFWLNEQLGPNAERFTDVWVLTYFCMATCSLLAIRRLLEANFQQYFCWVVDFMFQQVVLQVRREPQRSIVVRALHDWFCTFGNGHIVRTWQTGSVFSQWSQTSKQLGINGDSCQPTDSGSIAIVGLYRTICEWETFHCVVLFEVLVRFSLDVQPVRASRLREIFGPVATPMWKFSTNVGSLRRYCFPFSIYY